jgi:SNF2 family DNA or RNA helicase
MGLTATPIYNYGREIWNVMRFIRADVFGEWEDFCREYVDYGSGKLKDPKAVGTFMREQHAFLRRTKADVGKEMPAVNRIVDVVDYDSDVVESIEEVARQLSIRATTGAFVERGNAARELDLLVRQATGIAKAKHVAAVVRVLVEGGEPVLLFGWHREVYRIWNEELKDLNPVMYTGSESGPQKLHAKEEFLSGRSKLLIMSLRSAAGLDGLQAVCSVCVFGELDWSPGVHHQCIERIDRDGQVNPVMAMFLVAEDGSDPPMMEMLGLKSSEASQIIDPALGVQAVHSDQTRLQALVAQYLSKKELEALQAAPAEEQGALAL